MCQKQVSANCLTKEDIPAKMLDLPEPFLPTEGYTRRSERKYSTTSAQCTTMHTNNIVLGIEFDNGRVLVGLEAFNFDALDMHCTKQRGQ